MNYKPYKSRPLSNHSFRARGVREEVVTPEIIKLRDRGTTKPKRKWIKGADGLWSRVAASVGKQEKERE